MVPSTVRSLFVLGLATPLLLAQKPPAGGGGGGENLPPGYEQNVARYQECMQRLPFQYHTTGRQQLAETRCAPALATLIKDYGTVRVHPEESRYTLATMIGKNFDRPEHVDALTAMRLAYQKPVDMWLWVQLLRIHADRVGDTEVITIAQEGKNALVRAAAIAAVGNGRSANVKQVVVPTCVNFPPKDKEADRMVLLGAMTGALWANKSRVNDTEYRDALTAYIGLLGDDVGLSHTAKVQIARHLQWILKGPALFVNPDPWLELLARGEVKKTGTQHTVVAPRFFGVETDGERLCYVVDMSDSMCKPIEPSSKPAEKRGPVTGPRDTKKKKRELMDETDLPWDKIQNRWDLAREQLRISLLRLTPDKHFSVVWFGTESGTLNATKGMIKATKGAVDAAIAELDSIKAIPFDKLSGDDKRKCPDGQLRGKTNLHSGLRRAFGLAGNGFVDQNAYVDPKALTEGCDTIFLLSDGAPSWDDFHVVDKDYGEGRVVLDTEYGEAAQRTPQVEYHGPFVWDHMLIDDLERMNAFRRIRLHCVGLGEANMGLLRKLADVGRGEVFVFGDRKNDKKEPAEAGKDGGKEPGKDKGKGSGSGESPKK